MLLRSVAKLRHTQLPKCDTQTGGGSGTIHGAGVPATGGPHMRRWLTIPSLVLLLSPLAFAEPPRPTEPQFDGIELSIWVRNLDSDKPHVRQRAYSSILQMGAAAKPALPQIVEMLERTHNGLT